jgi:hypothetical protein
MFHKLRWRMRTLILVIAVSAVAIWVGINFLDWRESFHQWQVNRPIWRQLDQRVTLKYPNGLTLSALLGQIKTQTISVANPSGLTVYCDPEGMQAANQDINSVLKIDVQSMSIKDALESVLKLMGMKIRVHDGILVITGEDDVL